MYCPKCGREIDDHSKFCGYCGQALNVYRVHGWKGFIQTLKRICHTLLSDKMKLVSIAIGILAVILLVILIVLIGGRKNKNNPETALNPSESIPETEAASDQDQPVAQAETKPPQEVSAAQTETEPAQETAVTQTETVPSNAAASVEDETKSTESSKQGRLNTGMEVDLFLTNSELFGQDYGFSEERAWVYSRSHACYMIDPSGRIVYAMPVHTLNSADTLIMIRELHPMQNGVAYLVGTFDSNTLPYAQNPPITILIDSNGHEIARFTSDENIHYRILGRTEDRFLLACEDISGLDAEYYFVPIGLDGKPVDVPRLITKGMMQYDYAADDLGGGIFQCAANFTEGESNYNSYFYYNLNNNTITRTIVNEYDQNVIPTKFYDGKTLAEGYLLLADDLQEEHAKLILTNPIGFQGDYKWDYLTQKGRLWENTFIGVYTQDGKRLKVPEGMESDDIDFEAMHYATDDGYILFQRFSNTGKMVLSMMDLDNQILYQDAVFPFDISSFDIHGGTKGYIPVSSSELGKGIIDREGVFHTYMEDLSGLQELSELHFCGFGCGYLLETEGNLGRDYGSEAFVIRSLDGKTEVTSVYETEQTVIFDDEPARYVDIDFSNAKPIDYRMPDAIAEASADIKIDPSAAEGETGALDAVEETLIVESFDDDLLLFDKDGVRITWVPASGKYESYFRCENVNPDNLKATISFSGRNLLYDGMNFSGSAISAEIASAALTAGSSKSIYKEVLTPKAFQKTMTDIASGLR